MDKLAIQGPAHRAATGRQAKAAALQWPLALALSPRGRGARGPKMRSGAVLSSPSALSAHHRCTRAPPPLASFSTSANVAIEVSPSVVMARAPWAAPSSTAFWPPAPMSSP